jgi:hypothetical protein
LTKTPTNDAASSTSTTPDTPPIIQISGDNPAIVQVGDTHNDRGANITGPQPDLNLGITTYVNGIESSPVQLDTTEVATDTIAYVATDQNGLTATSTSAVIVEAPSIVTLETESIYLHISSLPLTCCGVFSHLAGL